MFDDCGKKCIWICRFSLAHYIACIHISARTSEPLWHRCGYTLTLFLNLLLAAYKCFTWEAEYFPSQWYTFTSHYHVKLFSIKCNPEIEYAWALHGLPNTWQKILFIFWRDAILWVSHGSVHKCPPLGFLLLDEVPRVLLSLRMLVRCYPVGGTVTLCQGCACWFPPAVAERIVTSATLYLSSLRSFRGWEKITVFADDNAIN